MNIVKHKHTSLFIFLSGIFLTNALLAEIIGTKIFSLEAVFGWEPAQIPLLGGLELSFSLTAGVMLWPVVFITTDIINEYFGKAGVRRISFLTAGFIAYGFFIIWIATELPPAQFWINLYDTDSAGNPLHINEAFRTVFLQSMGIIVGSLTAFLLGQIIDVTAFQWLRKFTGSKMLWLRATGSTLISQFFDSFVVLTIAFYYLSPKPWSIEQVISVGIINYIYKFSVAVILTPTLYIAHNWIDKYLGKEAAHEMIEEASKSKLF